MRRLLRTPTLALLVAAVACRPSAPAGEPVPEPEAPAYRGPLVSSLQVQAAADSVRFVLQVTNPTPAPVRISFASGMSHDFSVREGGREVWRWSADRSFVQSMVQISLASGETRTYAEVWRPAAALRGRRLAVVGRLTSANHPIQSTIPFSIP